MECAHTHRNTWGNTEDQGVMEQQVSNSALVWVFVHMGDQLMWLCELCSYSDVWVINEWQSGVQDQYSSDCECWLVCRAWRVRDNNAISQQIILFSVNQNHTWSANHIVHCKKNAFLTLICCLVSSQNTYKLKTKIIQCNWFPKQTTLFLVNKIIQCKKTDSQKELLWWVDY